MKDSDLTINPYPPRNQGGQHVGIISCGIDITYIKSANSLRIGGWYDGMVGISGGEIHLADFFSELGITEKDCKQAFSLLNIREFNKL